MKANKNILAFLTVSALTFLLAGCPIIQEPLEVVFRPDSGMPHQSESMSKRFAEAAPKGQTAIDSAIELSKKNIELFEQITVLQQKNQELTAENRRLNEQVAALEPDLRQTRKELDEANDLLIDMTTELNNWKMQILGFRDEMRNADTEQLHALLKILEILGGEVMTEASRDPDQNSATASPNEKSKTQLKETST